MGRCDINYLERKFSRVARGSSQPRGRAWVSSDALGEEGPKVVWR
jgi:hypothetical protein